MYLSVLSASLASCTATLARVPGAFCSISLQRALTWHCANATGKPMAAFTGAFAGYDGARLCPYGSVHQGLIQTRHSQPDWGTCYKDRCTYIYIACSPGMAPPRPMTPIAALTAALAGRSSSSLSASMRSAAALALCSPSASSLSSSSSTIGDLCCASIFQSELTAVIPMRKGKAYLYFHAFLDATVLC